MNYFKENLQNKRVQSEFTPATPIENNEDTNNTLILENRFALERELAEDGANNDAISGLAVSLGVELGGGLYLSHKLHKAKNISRTLKALQVARAVKTGSAAAVVAPEVGSTIAGIVGFVGAEAAIWGISNLAGQKIRQSFGIQDNMSAGEAMAASLFGVGILTSKATTIGQKVFNLTDGAGKLGAFRKMRTVGANFVSGASIGIAESTMRQSVQIMLNERESYDKYDYVLSGLIGGGLNTLIGALTASGAKGDEFIAEAQNRSLESLKKQKEQLLSQGKNKQARRIQEAIEVVEDFKAKLDAKNVNDENLKNKSTFEQEDPRGSPVPVDDPPKPTIKKPIVEEKFESKSKKDIEEEPDIPTEDAAPEPDIVSDRRKVIEDLRNRFSDLTNSGYSSKEIVTEIIPNFSREVAPLREELLSEFNRQYKKITRTLGKKNATIEDVELDELLQTMDDFIAFNDVRLSVETGAGRALLGFQGGAETYAFTGLSERAIREQELLMRIQDNMQALKKNSVLDPDLEKIKKDFDNVKPDTKNKFKQRQEPRLSEEEFSNKSYKELQTLAKERGIKANQKKDILVKELAKKNKQVSEEVKISRSVTTKIKKLEKALNSERNRVVALFDTPLNKKQKTAFEKQKEKALNSNPVIQDLQSRLSYYQSLQKQLLVEEKLKKELAQRSKLEGEGTISDLKDDIKNQKIKSELNETPSSIKELRKKIADSKKRVRDRIREIENAEGDMRYAELMRDLENWHYRALDTEHGISWTKFGRSVREARRMALIDQLPSVLAGVPAGLGRLVVKDVIRPLAEYAPDVKRFGLSKANQMFLGNYEGTFQSLLNWTGTGLAFARSFKEGELVTTHARNKFDERPDVQTSIRTMKNINAKKARQYAENRRRASIRFAQKAFSFENWGDGFWAVMSLGVRGIGAVDEIFRRQVVRGRIHANARKRAIIAHPDDVAAQKEHFKEEMKRTWVRDDGLEVLDDYRNHQNQVNSMNRDLFFAAQGENLDNDTFYRDAGEQLITAIKKVHNMDNLAGFGVDMFLPYVAVPVRTAYLGGKLAFSPLLLARGTVANPYNAKLQKLQKRLSNNQHNLREAELDLKESINKYGKDNREAKRIQKDVDRYRDEIRQGKQQLELVEDRKTHYTYESYVDFATGAALFGMGATMAANGMATGSLNFLDKSQQEKNGLRPFHGLGMDYIAAAPWALPFALGADMGMYQSIVNTEERYGVSIMKDNKSRIDAVFSMLEEIAKQVPLLEGVETAMTLLKSGDEARAKQLTKLAQSYIPIPAFVRKAVKALNDDNTIADLKGGTFMQKQAYYFLGMKPVNVQMDYFGFPKERPTERLNYLVMRQIPKTDIKFETEFDKILAGDLYNDIKAKPSVFYGVGLQEFITDEGVTLNTEFNRKLRDFKLVLGGKKITLKTAIERKINSRKWKTLYKGSKVIKYDEITGAYSNLALKELNKIIRTYHRELAKELFSDSKFTSQFVNKKEQKLNVLLEQRQNQLQSQGGNIRTLRELLKF